MKRSIEVILLVSALTLTVASPVDPQEKRTDRLVYSITLDDAIHPITASFFTESIHEANDAGAALIIVKLNTPGGLVTSMEDMIGAMTSSRAPVVVFVYGSSAASAGFFITIAADVAVMAPGTRIGAAHPVAGIGKMEKESTMAQKVENDLAAYVRSLAENRGRNVEQAEMAVRESHAFTEREALDLGLIDYIAGDEGEILDILDGTEILRFDGSTEKLDLGTVRIVTVDMSGREKFLSFLANPMLAALLLLAGLAGLYIEFTHPGMVAPGLIGGVCLLLFAMATQVLPVNWVGFALIILGVVMFILEINVTSYGMLTLGGVGCLLLGSLMLFRDLKGIPGLEAAQSVVFGIAASAAILMAFLTWLVAKSWRSKPVTGDQALVEKEGTALSDLDPEGRVFVQGEYWNAHARERIAEGARIRVVGVKSLQLEVEEIR